jgi:hypothetical protein
VVFCALLLATWGIFQPKASGQEAGHVQETGPAPESPLTPPLQSPAQAQGSQAPALQYDKTIFQKPIPSDQLSFLSHFSGAMSGDAVRDKQYRKLMRSLVPDCIFHYGTDMSLSEAFGKVLEDSTLPVRIREGRYFMVSGRSGPYLGGRGFMWIDMQDGVGLGGFYFRPTNGEPTPTVTIFSRQVREKSLGLSQLPPAFAEDLGRWSSEARVPLVTTRYFIGGSKEKNPARARRRLLLASGPDNGVAAGSLRADECGRRRHGRDGRLLSGTNAPCDECDRMDDRGRRPGGLDPGAR